MAGAGFKLTVDGAPVAPDVLAAVRRIVVEDHAELADMVRLRIGTAVTEDAAGWTILDDPGFGRLSRIGVTVTVGDQAPEPLIDAYVVQVAPQLSGDPGDSFVDVVGMDATVLLSLEEKIRAWPDQSDSAIATTIFGEHELQPDVEDTGRTRSQDAVTTVQRGTDMQFLRSLAERNGYEIYVESETSGAIVGHFHAPRPETTPQGTLTVAGGQASNVDRFHARFDMLRPASAEGQGLDASSGEVRTVEVTTPSVEQLGAEPPANGDRPRKVIVSSPATADASELQALAQAVVDQAAWALTAEGELSPAAYGGVLRAKRPVMVRGVGPTFSGTWYVERVVHVLAGDSYEQRFKLRRNAVGVKSSDQFSDDPGAAVTDAQRAFGKFRGTVTDVEDPEKRGRLKATVPEILHDVPSGWAEPCAPYGGDGEGLWAIPPVGAGVWVEFEAGDPSRPVWTGVWWPSGKVPNDAAGSPATPKVKVLRTTEGLHAALDDDGKTITISDDGGSNLVEIKSQGGQVTVKAGTKVVVDASQIELTDGASHALVFGDSLLQYLNQVVSTYQSHTHPGQTSPTGPVTPAPPTPPLPSPTSSLLSTKVKTG